MFKCKALILCTFFSCLLCFATVAHAIDIAKVIAVTGGVTVERGGQSAALNLKDALMAKDVVRTDATGKVQLMFNDDTTVSVGVNSQFAMEDYSDSGVKSFKSNVAVGFARFVTGTIVENNPEAFSVRTPEATVGIRGTTFTVTTRDQITTVFTESSLNAQSVVVKDVVIAPGFMATFGPNGELLSGPTPMTPEQREELIESSRIGSPVAGIGLGGVVDPLWDERLEGNLENSLSDSRLDDLHENPLSPSFVKDVHAVASGTFEFDGFGGDDSEGTFSFDANLTSGTLSNASFTTTDSTGGDFSASGGSGSIVPGGFNLSGSGTFDEGALGNSGNVNWNVQGTDALEFDDDVEGNLNITPAPGFALGGPYNGSIEGELKPK